MNAKTPSSNRAFALISKAAQLGAHSVQDVNENDITDFVDQMYGNFGDDNDRVLPVGYSQRGRMTRLDVMAKHLEQVKMIALSDNQNQATRLSNSVLEKISATGRFLPVHLIEDGDRMLLELSLLKTPTNLHDPIVNLRFNGSDMEFELDTTRLENRQMIVTFDNRPVDRICLIQSDDFNLDIKLHSSI